MPRVTLQQELDMLIELIGDAPDGMGIDAIEQKLGDGYQRRTLQRRLALLVEQHHIEMLGERRSTRYRRLSEAADRVKAHAPPPLHAPVQDYVPISAEGADIRAYVSQSRHLRRPIGYRQEFLEQYHPKHTAYLPLSLRE